jgi:hypothetical protein
MINVDQIFSALNKNDVQYLLIGGMNFLMRHRPVVTFDTDIWINDTEENQEKCELALSELNAEWGPTEDTWQPTRDLPPGWLKSQDVFSVTTDSGPVDVFRHVRGLESWTLSYQRAEKCRSAGDQEFWSLSDEDMLACQLALDEQSRKLDRVKHLKSVLNKKP